MPGDAPSDRAAILRLGVAPVLLLAWRTWLGDPLPFLAPSLLVPILLMGPTRPPLAVLGGLVVVVAALSFALVFAFVGLANSPASVWLGMLALATWCFARLDARPDAVLPLLALMTAAIVTALVRVSPTLALDLPWLMTGATLQAVVAALIVHALLPSRVARVAPPTPRPRRPGEALTALVRAAALVAALGFAMAMEDTSAILIGITAITVLRSPPSEAKGQGGALLTANLGAAALVVPALALAALRPEPAVILAVTLAASLWLAAGLGAPGRRGHLARNATSIFVVLAGLLLPNAGAGSLVMLGDRLLTLALTVVFALVVHALLRRSVRPA